MCKAFSCVITKEGNIYWKAGLDNHEDIIDLFKQKDKLLIDNELPANFARIEINPVNYDYLNPNCEWIFKFDDKKPDWWNDKYKEICYKELNKWEKEVYSLINIEGLRNPINPFNIEPPEINEGILDTLRDWASVYNSTHSTVWDSIETPSRALIGDSIWDSIWGPSWDSALDSALDLVDNSTSASFLSLINTSVFAYFGSLFKIKKWENNYPYQSAVDLWKLGLVPSFDNKLWRLHSKKGIEWEGEITVKEGK